MNWKKLGRIFNPVEHRLPNQCTDYAQSPQTLVFDDFVRIYFSSRLKDEEGKFLTQIAYADFDKSFNSVLNVSEHTVIPLGETGSFDEHGIFPLHVTRINNRILGYISGLSRRVSVTVESSIGISESFDNGKTFTRLGNGPVLTSSLHEPFLVCDPFVLFIDGKYHMWYLFGVRWVKESEDKNPDRVYKIGHATSDNGIDWVKEGRFIIEDNLGENECQALPTVICLDGRYHMFFCYRHAFGFRTDKTKGYRIGYAYSDDLVNWKRDDASVGIDVSDSDWDSEMLCYPHVFELDGKVYLLYNGNEFGRFGFGLAILER